MKPLLALAAVALFAAYDDKPADPKADQTKMQGSWTVESSVFDGHPAIPDDQIKDFRVVVKGDKRLVMKGDEKVSEATYTLDPKAKPKAITVKVSDGPLKGKEIPGIYELDGDTFKVCLNVNGTERPKEFKGDEGSGCMLQVCKREKK
jgi:uncharacterized protein (TIGR03067 family)